RSCISRDSWFSPPRTSAPSAVAFLFSLSSVPFVLSAVLPASGLTSAPSLCAFAPLCVKHNPQVETPNGLLESPRRRESQLPEMDQTSPSHFSTKNNFLCSDLLRWLGLATRR